MTGSPRIEADWFTAFASQLRTVQAVCQFGGSVELMLLGDSITFNMQWSAGCNQLMGGKRVLNFGVGGDETANLLWRINHGLLDGISPRADHCDDRHQRFMVQIRAGRDSGGGQDIAYSSTDSPIVAALKTLSTCDTSHRRARGRTQCADHPSERSDK